MAYDPMPASAAADREIEVSLLPNGLRVVTESMPHVRSVSVGIWVASGSRREQGPQHGLSHFLEHMVFKGTTRRSAEEIARSVDALGGNLDAFTGKEMVSFNAKILDEHLPAAFDILADLVLHALFRQPDIDKERGVVLEELKMENDNPEYLVHETFSTNFWKDHPLGKPILGTRETIRGFDRGLLADYYQSVYSPDNLLVTAAGNLKHGQLLDLVHQHFGDMPRVDAAPWMTLPKTHARLLLKDKKSLEQVHLLLGVPAMRVADDRRFAAYVLNSLLGGSMSSRLFQNIREQCGLVYAVFSELSSYHDTGCLSVYAGTSLEAVPEVIRLIVDEFRNFKGELVSLEELTRAKNHLKGSLMLGLESTSSRMANLARQQLYFERFFGLDETLESIDAVTAEAVQQVAESFLDARHIALTVLGSLDGLHIGREDLAC